MFRTLAERQETQKGKIFLGAPEAEAEASAHSQRPLDELYKDHCGLIGQLQYEKFIVIGRKGTGKSAFAEYICSLSKNEPNMFAKFIRSSDVSLEKIVQIGEEQGQNLDKENLYRWLILTNILKLFAENQAAALSPDFNLLRQFLNRNSGFIDINQSEVKELVKKQGFEVHVNYLKRFFTSKMNKNFEIRQEKAPFYKLIPHLSEVVVKVMTSAIEVANKNSYVLFFDDLDVGFDAQNPSSIESLISLIRASKEINNDLFGRNGIDAKVVLLLRDDISKKLSSLKTDTAKLFSSYSVSINWYQDDYSNINDERKLHIRQFLNDRIRYAFKLEGLDFDENDPWRSLVEEPFEGGRDRDKSSFKYVLDHTFFRPRDLLLFFHPLSLHAYKLPLSRADIYQLIGRYCDEMIDELKNELSCFYTPSEISSIFHAFGDIVKQGNGVKYNDAISIIKDNSDLPAHDLLLDMYQRSLIGAVDTFGHVKFKHRESNSNRHDLKDNDGIIVQLALRVYCQNKGYI